MTATVRDGAGWRLSPVFDVNPEPDTTRKRVTSIAWADGRAEELEALVTNARKFGLSPAQAQTILGEVEGATRNWRDVAASNGVPEAECAEFEGAFEDLRDAFRSRSRAPGPSRSRPIRPE